MDVKKIIATLIITGSIIAGGVYTYTPPKDAVQYEFLVRLVDKTSDSVICLNPAHKEEVVFLDKTGEAVCPVCKSSEFLYHEDNAKTKKGNLITFKPAGWSWGSNERKHYGVVRILCTEAKAVEWCAGITNMKKEAEADSLLIEMKTLEAVAVDKEVLKTAKAYVSLDDSYKEAKAVARIAYRPRTVVFDFESVLTAEQLANWYDQDAYSDIVEADSVVIDERE